MAADVHAIDAEPAKALSSQYISVYLQLYRQSKPSRQGQQDGSGTPGLRQRKKARNMIQ